MKISLDYKKHVLIEKTDDSNEVSVELKTLKTKDYNKLIKFFSQNSSATNIAENPLAMIESASNDEIMEISKALLPEYARNLKGVEIEESGSWREVKLEDLTEYAPLVVVNSLIIKALINISSVGQGNRAEAEELKKQ